MNEINPNFSLEERMQALREILAKMQSGSLDFDSNVKLFTQGMDLIKDCRSYLDTAEFAVKKLVDGEELDLVV